MRHGVVTLVIGLLAGCAEPQFSPPHAHFGDSKYFMGHLLDPAADVIWRSAGTVITIEGEQDLSPTDDEGWFQVEHSAAVISESGNLLMLPHYRRDDDNWVELSGALGSVGQRLIKAAEVQDKQAIFDLGGELYNICAACHQAYWPESPR